MAIPNQANNAQRTIKEFVILIQFNNVCLQFAQLQFRYGSNSFEWGKCSNLYIAYTHFHNFSWLAS